MQLGREQASREVLVPDVVLHVDRALGRSGGGRAVRKRDRVLLDETQSRNALLLAELSEHDLVERGRVRRRNGVRRDDAFEARCTRAMRE